MVPGPAARIARALAYPYERTHGHAAVHRGRVVALDPADAGTAGRTALVGYGSNASATRLAEKLAAVRADRPVPVLEATLTGYAVVHSAHLTHYGALPATLWPDPGARAAVTVALLTSGQLAALTASENGNYRMETLAPGVLHASGLPSPPPPVRAFVSRFGAWAPDGSPVPLGDQRAALERVAREVAGGIAVEDLILACGDDEARRAGWTAALATLAPGDVVER